MRLLRGIGRWAGTGLWLLVLAPAIALVPATVFDRGPGGEVRTSLFPFALVALDPFVWDSARNSLAVAVVVALVSLFGGVLLGRLVARRGYWGRVPFAALALAPLVVSPVTGALGLRILLGARLDAGDLGGQRSWLGWSCWVWVGAASGVPLVTLAAASALSKIDPAWILAGRLAGASRLLIWRQLLWPVVRPEVAGSAAMVFTLTLVEPGAPLLLGLRRTLAFQTIEAVASHDPLPRAAVLALCAAGLAVLGRVLLGWWGGASAARQPQGPIARDESVTWPRAAVSLLVLGGAAVIAWLPGLVVIVSALLPGRGWLGASPVASTVLFWFDDPRLRTMIANSLWLGLAVVGLDLVLAWTIVAWGRGRPRVQSALSNWPEWFPPLALGVGALSIPWLLRLSADASRTGRYAPLGMGRGLVGLADGLDPYRTPGVLLVIAVAAQGLPLVARAVALGHGHFRRVLFDAAVNLGASARRARRRAAPGWFGASSGVLLLTTTLAATNLAPALVLAPTIASRTVSPGVLILADAPGDGLTNAARLATCAVIANLIAFAWAARGRDRSVAECFRGGS